MKKYLLGFLMLSCLFFLGVKKADAAANAITVSEAGITNSSTTAYYGQTVAVFGFDAIVNNGLTANLSSVSFNTLTGNGLTTNLSTDFSAAQFSLVSSSTANYNTSTTLAPVSAMCTLNPNTTITFAITGETISTTVSKYYFLVVNFNTATALSLPDSYRFEIGTVKTTGPTISFGANDNGSTYAFTNAAVTQDQTGGTTTSLTTAPSTNTVLFGLKLTATAGSSTLTALNFSSTQTISALFSGNVNLYVSSNNTFDGTAVSIKTLLASGTGTTISFTGLSQALTTSPKYFYVVIDTYSNPPTATGTSIEVDLTGKTALNTTFTLAAGSDATGTPCLLSPLVALGNVSGGVNNATLSTDQSTSPVSAVPLVGFSITTAKSETFTKYSFTIPAGDLAISGPFSTIQLYSSAFPTYSGGPLTLIPSTYTTNTITPGAGQTVLPGTPIYYYVVANYTAPVSSGVVQMNLASASVGGTAYTSGAPINGAVITCTTPVTLATAAIVNAAPNPINGGALPVNSTLLGFTIKTTQNETFTQFNFSANTNIATYFSGFTLWVGTTNDANASTTVQIPVSPANITVSGTSLTIAGVNQLQTAGTSYYFVKEGAYTPPTATATFELDATAVNTSGFIFQTGAPAKGTSYTLNPIVTLSTATTTGLAANPLNYSQSNIGVFGFTVTTSTTEAFTAFNLTASSTFASNNFSNVRIYRNTTNTFTNASANLVAISTPVSLTSINPTFTFTTPETVNLGAPAYYFVVVDFVNPTVASTFQLSLKNAAVGSTLYTNGATPLGTISSTNYNCGPATNNWVGGSGGNDWNVAANWSYNVVPLPADNVQIGVTTYTPSTNNPIIAAADPAITVASITFGSNNGNNITLTANNALTVTNDITVQADDNSNGLQTFLTILGLKINVGGSNPTGIINVNLAGSSSITATNLKIISNDDLLAKGLFTYSFSDYNETLNSSVTSLNILGNVILTSTYNTAFGYDNLYSATFLVSAGTANVTTVNGVFQSTNVNDGSGGSTNKATSFITATGGTLILNNVNAMPSATTSHGPGGLDIVGSNVIDFTGGGTVSYPINATQTVYTEPTINSVTTGPSYNSLTLAGTGIKNLSTPTSGVSSLDIGGDFNNLLANNATNYITLTNTNNKVVFNGTSAQKLYGGAGTGTIFNNVEFSGASTKTMSTGTFTVISAGTLSMTSTSTSCILAAGGLLTLKSDSASTATVAAFSGSKITGNVNVQRYVTGGLRGYRLFSSPVNISGKTAQTGTNPANEAFVDPTYLNYGANGGILTGGPGTGFTNNNISNPLSYLYDDTRASNGNQFFSGKNVGIYSIIGSPTYKVIPMNTDGTQMTAVQIPVGNSFLAFYTGTSSLSNPSPESAVATATGTLNQGTINVWLYRPSSGTSQNLVTGALKGSSGNILSLNQVGNPYPSTIQLGGTTGFYHDNSGNIKPVIYELDGSISPTGTYLAFNASGTTSTTRATNYIVSGQGFWVQTLTNAGTYKLVFNETEKTSYFSNTSTDPNYGVLLMDIPTTPSNNDVAVKSFAQSTTTAPVTNTKTPLVGLHLQLSKDSITQVQTGIYFSSLWTDTFNDNDDAIDLDGTSPKLYFSSYSSDGKRLAINQLADYSKSKRVKLYAGATTSGLYKISIADLINIDTLNYNIYLVDHKLNDSLDMVKYKSYAFNIDNSDTTTYGANRFTFVIERHALPPYQLLSFSGQKVNNGIQLIWKTLNEGTYTSFALQKLGGSNTYASIYATPGSGSGLYSYVDMHPTTGNNTYRLQQTDIDGKVTYSAPVTVRYSGSMANGTLTIYPNPARSIINVSLNTNGPGLSNYMVDIYNMSGTIIDHKTVNTNTWTQDVSNYKLGVYVIEIKTSTGYLVGESKFVKIN